MDKLVCIYRHSHLIVEYLLIYLCRYFLKTLSSLISLTYLPDHPKKMHKCPLCQPGPAVHCIPLLRGLSFTGNFLGMLLHLVGDSNEELPVFISQGMFCYMEVGEGKGILTENVILPQVPAELFVH